MLDNIKSTYFTKIIFCILDEGRKLDIIKYNKRMQNNMNINLIDYKIYSGRYILYKTNKKGEEYDGYHRYYDILLYEGEYLNGKKNGKGKEYDKYRNLIFSGEYLNGKRNGKGKEYDIHGNLIFEGEYLNGKKWNGKGNEDKYKLKNGKGIINYII